MSLQSIKHIVVPIDFSPHSGAALQWADQWQQHTGARVTVLHCRSYEAPPTFTMDQLDGIAVQAVRSVGLIRDETTVFIEQQLGHAVDWVIEIKDGDPVQLILEQCACADLIIMGTHGRHGMQRWMLGSVAESMIHAAKVPVLVVHQPPAEIEHILTAINGSAHEGRTLETAAHVAGVFGADLYSLHVIEPHKPPVAPPEAVAGMPVQHLERTGKAAEQILTGAGEIGAGMIVLAAAPRRFLEIDILPPTVTQVLQYGAVPVLVLPQAFLTKGVRA